MTNNVLHWNTMTAAERDQITCIARQDIDYKSLEGMTLDCSADWAYPHWIYRGNGKTTHVLCYRFGAGEAMEKLADTSLRLDLPAMVAHHNDVWTVTLGQHSVSTACPITELGEAIQIVILRALGYTVEVEAND